MRVKAEHGAAAARRVSKRVITREVARICASARTPRLRGLREFAEQEIVTPDGTYRGLRFKARRQPAQALFLDLVDSGRFSRVAFTAPTQFGKTLVAWVLPAMWHLFELGETVILAVKDMAMAADKWRQDLQPAILRSRYRDLIPSVGAGSRSTAMPKKEGIMFQNGAILRFMTGGGAEKGVAGFTSRVLIVTETDGFDAIRKTDRETDRISALEARTDHYGSRRRIYLECTVSTEKGRIWQELKGGTDTRLVLFCPECSAHVGIERENLTGWEAARSVAEARELGRIVCPECDQPWTEQGRIAAVQGAKAVHANDAESANTLSFRCNGAANLFWSVADLSERAYRASNAADAEAGERAIRQFTWAVPAADEATDVARADAAAVARRVTGLEQGQMPRSLECLTIGLDIGKWLCHWTAIAWEPSGHGRIVDYATFPVDSDTHTTENAILYALRGFREEIVDQGWLDRDGETVLPNLVLVDAQYNAAVIQAFCAESRREDFERIVPVIGYGHGQERRSAPSARSEDVQRDGYVLRFDWETSNHVVHADVNTWKSRTIGRLRIPALEAGAITLYKAEPRKHARFSRQIAAEEEKQIYVAGKGVQVVWEQVHRQNHFLDATNYAVLAANVVGMRAHDGELAEPAELVEESAVVDGDGFLAAGQDDEAFVSFDDREE